MNMTEGIIIALISLIGVIAGSLMNNHNRKKEAEKNEVIAAKDEKIQAKEEQLRIKEEMVLLRDHRISDLERQLTPNLILDLQNKIKSYDEEYGKK